MTTGWGESGGVDRVHVAGGADAGFCGFGSRPLPPCANISLPGAKLGCPRPGSAPRDRGQRLSPVQIAAAGCGTREKGANRDHKRAGETSRGNGGRACEREGCGGHGNAGRTSQLLGLQEGKARHGFLARTGKGRRDARVHLQEVLLQEVVKVHYLVLYAQLCVVQPALESSNIAFVKNPLRPVPGGTCG